MNEDSTDHRPPSGEQFVIAYASTRAQITQTGATLRSLTVDGWDVIDGFSVHERSSDGRGQVLAPWPNRLTDGAYRYGGHDCQAPLNEIERGDAIHGLVRWLDWSPVSREESSVILTCALRPQPGYEWQLDLSVQYELGEDGLVVTFHATNVGQETAPFGLGFHPYLTLGTPSIDQLLLTVPATRVLRSAGDSVDSTKVDISPGSLDFVHPRPIGSTQLDHAYGALVRETDGSAVARLTEPGTGRSVSLWVDESFHYLMIYTADQVGRPERRRNAVALEPMTCPPDAFRTGTDLIELPPRGSWEGSWGIRPTGT